MLKILAVLPRSEHRGNRPPLLRARPAAVPQNTIKLWRYAFQRVNERNAHSLRHERGRGGVRQHPEGEDERYDRHISPDGSGRRVVGIRTINLTYFVRLCWLLCQFNHSASPYAMNVKGVTIRIGSITCFGMQLQV